MRIERMAKAALLLLILSGNEPIYGQQSSSLQIERTTIESYQKLGGTYGGWVNTPQGMQFQAGSTFAAAGLPGFSFARAPTERLAPIKVPYGLQLRFSDDEDLKLLASWKAEARNKLVFLDISWSSVSEKGIVALGLIPNLTTLWVDGSSLMETSSKALAGLTKLRTLRIKGGRQVTDKVIESLTLLPSLTSLDLSETGVTDLKGLSSLNSLTSVNLAKTQIGKNGLKELSRLPKITSLNLHFTQLTGQLSALPRLDTLTTLDLSQSGICDEDVGSLRPFKQLVFLDVSGNAITSVQPISSLKNLVALNLANTKVTDFHGLSDLKKLAILQLSGLSLADADMKEIGKCTTLSHLSLDHTDLTDVGLQEVRSLRNLESLRIDWTCVSSKGLKSLAPLKRLETLRLTRGYHFHVAPGGKITDESVQVLREIGLLHTLNLAEGDRGVRAKSPNEVISLDLRMTEVTNKCLKDLAIFENLKVLRMSLQSLDDTELQELHRLPNLITLDLSDSDITDIGVKQLSHLKHLTSLNLSGTNVTDKCVNYLKGITSLKSIDLTSSNITKLGRAELRKALPDCLIIDQDEMK